MTALVNQSHQPLLALVQQAALELGLAKPTTVVGNPDQQVSQLLALAQREAREMMTRGTAIGGWQMLRKEYAFSMVATQEAYPMPADIDHLIPGTFWDRSFRWQLLGPLSPQEWQVLKSGISPTGPRRRFRIFGGMFEINPVPSDTNQLAYEYYSVNWCQSATAVGQNRWLADTDTYLLDDDTLVMGLIWRFRRAKGLDYDTERAEWDACVDRMLARQAGSRSLPLNLSSSGPHLLNQMNVPDTGYGQ
jgi:hypothetical protein